MNLDEAVSMNKTFTNIRCVIKLRDDRFIKVPIGMRVIKDLREILDLMD